MKKWFAMRFNDSGHLMAQHKLVEFCNRHQLAPECIKVLFREESGSLCIMYYAENKLK